MRADVPVVVFDGGRDAARVVTLAWSEGEVFEEVGAMVFSVMQAVVDVSKFTLRPAPEDGEVAWGAMADEVDARVGAPVTTVNTELQEAAERAIDVLDRLHGDEGLYAKFKLAGSVGLFDFAVLKRTQTVAWALWHARHEQRCEELMPERKVDDVTLEEAVTLRAKLARVAKYHLEFHQDEGPLVQSVTADRERRKIANDLEVLAKVFKRHYELLTSDPYYEADGAERAHVLAMVILRALGKTERATWTDRCAVLWTMLLADYKEVRDAGRWLLRARPDEAIARFPGLVPQRKRGSAKGEDGADVGADASADASAPQDASDEAGEIGEGEEAEGTTGAATTATGAATAATGAARAQASAGEGTGAVPRIAAAKAAGGGAKKVAAVKRVTSVKATAKTKGKVRAAAKKR